MIITTLLLLSFLDKRVFFNFLIIEKVVFFNIKSVSFIKYFLIFAAIFTMTIVFNY